MVKKTGSKKSKPPIINGKNEIQKFITKVVLKNANTL